MTNLITYYLDTFTWTKLFFLFNNGWSDLVIQLIHTNNIHITHEIKQEIEYRHLNIIEESKLLEYVTIDPRIKIDYLYYEHIGFDKADSSLIEYYKRTKAIIVTEDHPLIAHAIIHGYKFIQLIDLFMILFTKDQIKYNAFFKLIKILRKMRNITKYKQKKALKFIRDNN